MPLTMHREMFDRYREEKKDFRRPLVDSIGKIIMNLPLSVSFSVWDPQVNLES